MALLSVTLPKTEHAALLYAVKVAELPIVVPVILERAVDNADGTRTLRIDRSIAWMLVTNLRGAGEALNKLEAAYWAAGGPDTGSAERSLISAAHDRGASILQQSEAA